MSTTVDLGKITASVTVGTTTTGAAGTNASVSNSGTTQDAVLNFTIPRGAQGVQGPQGIQGNTGPAGPTGPQGPMGDVAVITPEQQAAFTMYSTTGQNTDGPMTQKGVTDNLVASAISYDNSQSGLASGNVQGALDLCSSKNELNHYAYTSGQYLDANGEPHTVTNQIHKVARYVVYGGAMVRIKGRSGGSSTLASARNANGLQVAQYEQGKGTNYTDTNAFVTILPSDARYLYVTGNSELGALPSVEIVNNVSELDKEFESRCDLCQIYPTEGAKYIKTNQGVGSICDFTDEENYVANAEWGYYLVGCSEGDAFKLTGTGLNTPRLFCFLDSSMQILMVADGGTAVTNIQLFAPSNSAYLIVNVKLDAAFSLKKTVRTSGLQERIRNIDKELFFNKITSYTQLNYSINRGAWVNVGDNTSSLIYIGHLHGKRIRLVPNPTQTTYKIAFFNAVPVVKQNVSYCAGTAAITSDEEYQVVPDDALYLWIRYRNGNTLWYPSEIEMPLGEESTVATLKSAVETLANEMKDVNAEASGLTLYDYVGMKPTYKNKFGVTQLQTLPSWSGSQACAVIGNYMIVGVTFDQGATAARVYDLESNTLLGTISFNFGTYYKPHANTICFGTEMPDANSPFPALYLSQLDSTGLANKGSEYGVLVYSISSSYTSTFLQAILPDKTDTDLMNKIGAGTPNYIIDRDNGFLWVVGYKTATWQSYDNIQTFTKFQLPLLSAGSEVILTNADVLDSFELPMYPYTAMQEGVFKNGRLYIQMGVNGTIQGMRVVNVDTQEIETSLQTTQIFSTEPQGLAFWDDEMVWYESGTSGILYKFNFY